MIVEVKRNGRWQETKNIYIHDKMTFENLIKVLSDQFLIDVKRIFDQNGVEFEDIESIREDDILFISEGEDFITSSEFFETMTKKRKDEREGFPIESSLPTYIKDTIRLGVSEFMQELDSSDGWSRSSHHKGIVMSKKIVQKIDPISKISRRISIFRSIGEINRPAREVFDFVVDPYRLGRFQKMLQEVKVVETLNENTEIIHEKFKAIRCLWKAARDFSVVSYHCENQRNDVQSFISIHRSLHHPSIPICTGYTRSTLFGSGFYIVPKINDSRSCNVVYLTQVDLGKIPQPLLYYIAKQQPLVVYYVREELERNATKKGPVSFQKEKQKHWKSKTVEKWSIPYKSIELRNLLGIGKYGLVYEGLWHGTRVAVKRLKQDFQDNQDFQQEAILMIRIKNHQNVVSLYGITKEPFCIVMEYCPNKDLQKYIRQHMEIPREKIIHFIKGICAGMLHLTKQGIIHRDLATRNILLSSNWEPKISDFGLSRYLKNKEEIGITESLTGPIRHMAPESIRYQEYSQKTDVWAFGCVCYEICNRTPPFEKYGIAELASRIVSGPIQFEFDSRKRSEKCSFLVRLMNQCISFDPQLRPTFSEIFEEIESKIVQHQEQVRS